MRDVVVFCSDVINSLGLIRTLGESGYNIECLCYGNMTNYILGSKYVKSGYSFKTCEDAVGYLVKQYPIKDNKPVLFTIPDPPAYHVDHNKDILEKKFILFNAGKAGQVVYWMDKLHICDLARKHGLLVPWSVKLSKSDTIPSNIEYPVFVKSSVSTIGGKCDEGICFSQDELTQKKQSLISEEFIIMQFIKKVKEINYFGLAIKGNIYIDYHDLRERFPDDGYGYYNSFHICKYDDLHNKMVSMIRETGYQGLFDVEFLVDELDNYYFTEVNFRVDGEIYKLAAGINLPDYWCRLSDTPNAELPERLITNKTTFTGITELDDFKLSVLSGKMNVFKWLWQFLTADRRMLFNFKDPMPMLIKFWTIIKGK